MRRKRRILADWNDEEELFAQPETLGDIQGTMYWSMIPVTRPVGLLSSFWHARKLSIAP
jgi:hypothetical protein